MEIDDRRRMVAAIDPTHALGASVGAIVEVELEIDLITKSFFRRHRATRLMIRAGEHGTTEDTEEKNGKGQRAKREVITNLRAFTLCPYLFALCSASSVVHLISRSRSLCE